MEDELWGGRVGSRKSGRERKKDGEMKKEQRNRDRLRRKKRQQCKRRQTETHRERHTDPDRDKSRCRGTGRHKDIEIQGLLQPLPPTPWPLDGAREPYSAPQLFLPGLSASPSAFISTCGSLTGPLPR